MNRRGLKFESLKFESFSSWSAATCRESLACNFKPFNFKLQTRSTEAIRDHRCRPSAALLKGARTVHLYVTLFGLALLMFFAVTGFMLNHEGWFLSPDPHMRELEGTVPPNLLGTPPAEPGDGDAPKAVPADKFAVVEMLRKNFAAVGEVTSFEEESDRVRVLFERPGGRVEASIRRDDGHAEVTLVLRGGVGVALDLHRGKASGLAWSLVIDGVCVAFVLIGGTGLVLWSSLKGRGRYGWAVAAAGAALGGGVILAFVP